MKEICLNQNTVIATGGEYTSLLRIIISWLQDVE